MAATKRIAAPHIIARAGADVLERIERHNEIDRDAYANAVGKAIEQLIAAIYYRRESAVFIFPSRSRGRRLEHRTGPDTCSCEAAREGVPCWHRAARHLIIELERQQAKEAAERFQATGELPPPPIHCRHCAHMMQMTVTPAGEPCYECSNPKCQWTVMAAACVPAQPQAKLEPVLEQPPARQCRAA